MCTAIAVKQLHVSSSTDNFQKHSATFLSSPKFHHSHLSQKLHYKDILLFKKKTYIHHQCSLLRTLQRHTFIPKRHTHITHAVYSEHYKDILLFKKDIHTSPMQSTQNTTKTYFYSKKTYIHHPCTGLHLERGIAGLPQKYRHARKNPNMLREKKPKS